MSKVFWSCVYRCLAKKDLSQMSPECLYLCLSTCPSSQCVCQRTYPSIPEGTSWDVLWFFKLRRHNRHTCANNKEKLLSCPTKRKNLFGEWKYFGPNYCDLKCTWSTYLFVIADFRFVWLKGREKWFCPFQRFSHSTRQRSTKFWQSHFPALLWLLSRASGGSNEQV